MPKFYLSDESHTLASALRPELEAAHPDDLVACTQIHPLDTFLEVVAPSESALRVALTNVKVRLATAREEAEASRGPKVR